MSIIISRTIVQPSSLIDRTCPSLTEEEIDYMDQKELSVIKEKKAIYESKNLNNKEEYKEKECSLYLRFCHNLCLKFTRIMCRCRSLQVCCAASIVIIIIF